MVQINIKEKDVKQTLKDDNWAFFNKLLYDLCSNNFEHKKTNIVMTKICIIGRSYSASIERRKINGKKPSSENFYEKKVAPMIIRSNIDQWINELKTFNEICENNLDNILNIHAKVMGLFNKISGINKRSLASKYLHFHLPNLFYIYDSRAVKGLRSILHGYRIKHVIKRHDEEYSKFFIKSLYLQNNIKDEFNISLSTRQLDRLLLMKS